MARPGRKRLKRRRVPAFDPQPGHKFYVVHTEAQKEMLAHHGLRERGYEVLYLRYPDTVSHANRKIGVERPYFPRYLFIATEPDEGIYHINTAPGVSTVLYGPDGPFELPSDLVVDLCAMGDDTGLIKGLSWDEKQQRRRFEIGQSVEIVEGTMRGYFGVVKVDKGNEVVLKIEMFREMVDATFAPRALKPA